MNDETTCNLTELASYLSSEQSPGDCMLLSDLDGFLTGVLCAPELITPSEWLPVVFGGSLEGVDERALDLVLQRYNDIVAMLNNDPPILEPIFWKAREGHLIAMDWCEGFMNAVGLRHVDWDRFIATKQGRTWMQPIIGHTFDENNASRSGVTERELDAYLDRAAKQIPKTVPQIFTYWRTQRSPL